MRATRIDVQTQIDLLRQMILSRVLEQTCCELNPRWFPAEGEEAVLVGAFYGLRLDDIIAPHYRGPFITYAMRGADLARLVGQALGKEIGYARGRAPGFTGPFSLNIVPWVAGDLGTSIGVATGTALASQYDQMDRVTVLSFGDGTTNRGDFHEGLNLAAVWRLPIVYVCQHNQYSISLHASQVLGCGQIAARAAGYGIPGVTIDGNDVLTVHAAVQDAVARARSGGGPTLVEACTYRVAGHWASDPGGYRTDEEVAPWQARDPIAALERALREAHHLDAAGIERLWQEAQQRVQAAVEVARAAPDADPTDLGFGDVFAQEATR